MAPFAAAGSPATRAREFARGGLRLAAGMALGGVGGFVASLLRRRPPTSYATSLRQPVATDDRSAATGVGGQR